MNANLSLARELNRVFRTAVETEATHDPDVVVAYMHNRPLAYHAEAAISVLNSFPDDADRTEACDRLRSGRAYADLDTALRNRPF